MKNIPRILPIIGVTVVGVLAVNALAGAKSMPDMLSGAKAFAEDKRMIEAQWRTMRATGTRVMPLAMDKALLKYDAALKRFLARAPGTRSENQAA